MLSISYPRAGEDLTNRRRDHTTTGLRNQDPPNESHVFAMVKAPCRRVVLLSCTRLVIGLVSWDKFRITETWEALLQEPEAAE